MASRKLIALRRDDRCVVCATPIDAGTKAFWDAGLRTVTCQSCVEGVATEPAARRHRPIQLPP